jgi:oligopeptide/dipeptide ABC transporter ATP-binding protein
LRLDEQAMRRIRGNRIAMIFQEPMTALHPVFSIGEQIVEAIELHQPLCGKAAWVEAVELLRKVGIAAAEKRVHDYPHQLSGGMRQRAMIAMALACRPALLIADEPTTALDVTIQAQILDLLRSLQAETGMSVLLIAHDLGVVAETAHYVYVMYAGRIVEHGPTSELLSNPLHPYTQGLLRCMPRIGDRAERLAVIPGAVPDPSRFPSGCRFHPRCALSAERASDTSRHSTCVGDAPYTANCDGSRRILKRCVEVFEAEASGVPALREIRPRHFVACWEAM